MNITGIICELRNLQEVVINISGHRISAAPQLNSKVEQVLTALSIPPPAYQAS